MFSIFALRNRDGVKSCKQANSGCEFRNHEFGMVLYRNHGNLNN